jgi:hypothetical protein
MVQTSFRLVYRCLAAALILSLLLLVQGYSDLPVQQLPPALSLVKIGTGQPGATFAPDPDNAWLALADNGLHLTNLKTNQKIQLSPDTPAVLAWNPSGERLTAAFSSPEKSTLQVLKKKFERGAISREVYAQEKKLLLELSLKGRQEK